MIATPALTFEVGCLACAGQLALTAHGRADRHQTVGALRCSRCGRRHVVRVQLEIEPKQ